jgi:D-alanyl-D-alanine dipeptidase
VEGTPLESFVADGTKGGRHNYGVAVDLTIATSDGTPLDMGAPFDDFNNTAAVKGDADTSEAATRTPEVYRAYAEEQVRSGVLSRNAADNRMLLIEVMHEAGLVPYRREWWHFEELMSMSETRATYKLLNF